VKIDENLIKEMATTNGLKMDASCGYENTLISMTACTGERDAQGNIPSESTTLFPLA